MEKTSISKIWEAQKVAFKTTGSQAILLSADSNNHLLAVLDPHQVMPPVCLSFLNGKMEKIDIAISEYNSNT